MCCFSQPVKQVASTRIFVRPVDRVLQVVAYQMNYSAAQDLAMILPLPVAKGTGENEVLFIDFKDYKEFFADLEKGFPQPIPAVMTVSAALSPAPAAAPLKVQQVGDFEASFVPTVADFSRLDARFRLPKGTWEKLPAYSSYGFAVFKLKPAAKSVHPMVFTFPRRDPATVFFPTVHIHDGEVHKEAWFDHVLYCQPTADLRLNVSGWQESRQNAEAFVSEKKSLRVVMGDHHCYRKELVGNLPNQDTFLPVIL